MNNCWKHDQEKTEEKSQKHNTSTTTKRVQQESKYAGSYIYNKINEIKGK